MPTAYLKTIIVVMIFFLGIRLNDGKANLTFYCKKYGICWDGEVEGNWVIDICVDNWYGGKFSWTDWEGACEGVDWIGWDTFKNSSPSL